MTSTTRRFEVDFRNEYIRFTEADVWTVASLTWSRDVPRLDASSLHLEYRLEDPFPISPGTGTAMTLARRLEVLDAMIRELLGHHAGELVVDLYEDRDAPPIASLVERLRNTEGLLVRTSLESTPVDLSRRWPGQPRLVRDNRMRFGRVDEDVVRDLLVLASREPEGFLRLEYGEEDFIQAIPWPDDAESSDRFYLEWRDRDAKSEVTAENEPLTLEQTVRRFLEFHGNRQRSGPAT